MSFFPSEFTEDYRIERTPYRTIILEKATTLLFVHMIKSRLRPDIFYQSRTKVLCIFSIEPPDSALFPALSGIENLAIFNSRSLGVKELNALAFSGPRPSKLSSHWHWAVDPPESHPAKSFPLPLLFQNVTHLELEIVHESFDGKQLHSLKHLTHLSLVQPAPATSASWVPTFLQRLFADSIAVCIIFSDLDFQDGDLSYQDPRVSLRPQQTNTCTGSASNMFSGDRSQTKTFYQTMGKASGHPGNGYVGRSRADSRNATTSQGWILYDHHLGLNLASFELCSRWLANPSTSLPKIKSSSFRSAATKKERHRQREKG
ncbi:hypothetical protein C8J56DRAFT_1095074 [Mycena floridula]|nr:hypothetical protein C8J56DRAFT_1095074 [Mycena floridula]